MCSVLMDSNNNPDDIRICRELYFFAAYTGIIKIYLKYKEYWDCDVDANFRLEISADYFFSHDLELILN